MTRTQELIEKICDEVKAVLLEKNRAYGDSAINPLRIFSRTDAIEQINVRIDDKLSRISRGHEYGGDDTELDLIGYLVLKRVARTIASEDEKSARVHNTVKEVVDQTFEAMKEARDRGYRTPDFLKSNPEDERDDTVS